MHKVPPQENSPRKPDFRMASCLLLSLLAGFAGGFCSIRLAAVGELPGHLSNITCKNLKVVESNSQTQIELTTSKMGPLITLFGNDGNLSMKLAIEDLPTKPKEQTAGLYIHKKGTQAAPFAIIVEDNKSSSISMGELDSPAFASLRVFPSKDLEFASFSIGGLHQANIFSGREYVKISAGQGESNVEFGKREEQPPYFAINGRKFEEGFASKSPAHSPKK